MSASPLKDIIREASPHGVTVDLMGNEFEAPKPQTAPTTTTATTTTTVAAPAKFTRVIKGQNGAGDQVFEADTAEALLDKLAEAQTHATAKIRELAQAKRTRVAGRFATLEKDALIPAPRYLPNPTVEDVNLLQTDPRNMLQLATAVQTAVNKVQELEHKAKLEAAEAKAAKDFVRNHSEDYIPDPDNWDAIEGYLKSQNAPITQNNLEYAYSFLVENDGLPVVYEAEGEPQVTTTTTAPAQTATRIEPVVAPAATVTAVRTGMPAGGGIEPPAQAGPEDLSQIAARINGLSMEDARAEINKLMHAARSRQPQY